MSDSKPYRKEAVLLDNITVPYKDGGSTLEQMGFQQFPAGTRHVSFLNTGIYNIYVGSDGDANTGSYILLPTGGCTLRISAKTAWNKLYFYVVAGEESTMNVQCEGAD